MKPIQNKLFEMGKEAVDGGGGDVGDFLFGEVITDSKGAKDFTDEGWLIALATMRDWRHVGAVSLQDDAVERDTCEGAGEIGLLEGEDATDAQDEILKLEKFTCFNLIARETVEHAPWQIVLIPF